MNSLLDRSDLRSRPPQATTDPPPFSSDESDSAVFRLSESSVLILSHEGHDLLPVTLALEAEGFVVVRVSSATDVQGLPFLPRFGIIETSLPGALELIGSTSQPEQRMEVLALLGPGESESGALDAGASVTLHLPLHQQSLLHCLRRFRAHDELVRQTRNVFDRERGSIPSPVLESVLATIGHEIKNPLAAALASVECLRDADSERCLAGDERKGAVEDTALALRRIRDVMDSVTSLVRGTPTTLERVSFWDASERAVGSFSLSGVRVELSGDRSVRGWACLPLLDQVVINLVENAIDAARGQASAQILVRVYRVGLEARISVRDNGPGIPSALRKRIFEPFFSTKGDRGTGLGLMLVHHAVSRMGGTVTLGPARVGAVFRVRLRGA
jgi:signal transduction histidine kinase